MLLDYGLTAQGFAYLENIGRKIISNPNSYHPTLTLKERGNDLIKI